MDNSRGTFPATAVWDGVLGEGTRFGHSSHAVGSMPGTGSAAAIRFASGRLGTVLAQRGYGGRDAEALVMLAATDAVTMIGGTPERVEAGAELTERGLPPAQAPAVGRAATAAETI